MRIFRHSIQNQCAFIYLHSVQHRSINLYYILYRYKNTIFSKYLLLGCCTKSRPIITTIQTDCCVCFVDLLHFRKANWIFFRLFHSILTNIKQRSLLIARTSWRQLEKNSHQVNFWCWVTSVSLMEAPTLVMRVNSLFIKSIPLNISHPCSSVTVWKGLWNA